MVKWDDTQKLKLLRTAIQCFPGFHINGAEVARRWTTEDGRPKPTKRAAEEQFRSIMKFADDLESLSNSKKDESDEDEEAPKVKNDPGEMPLTPPHTSEKKMSSARKPARSTMKAKKAMPKTPKKRKHVSETDNDASSFNETTSGSESDVVTPARKARNAPPRRASKRITTTHGSDGSEWDDAGGLGHAAAFDTDGSDGEYDYAAEKVIKKQRN